MASQSKYLANKLIDWFWRGQVFSPPAIHYFAYFTSTHGPRANSTAYALNNTVSVVCNDGKVNLYKVTTAGATAAAQGALFAGTSNEVITDGTAVLTEQTTGVQDGTSLVEVAGGAYARVALTASLANMAGTQAAASTTASSGISRITSNNIAITHPAPTANWGFLWALGTFDASTAGNLLMVDGLNTAKTVNSGDAAPSIAISAYTFQIDTV